MAKRRGKHRPQKGRPKQARSPRSAQKARPQPVAADSAPNRALWLVPPAVGIAALAIYLATLQPSVPTGDSGELISAAYVGGVAHPPGYPVYTMVGWAATHLLPGSPAVVMNLLSALFQAAAVALVAILTARLVSANWPRGGDLEAAALAGASAGAALAVSTAFWAYALVAEVFALNDLFATALLLLAFEWYRDRSKVWALWMLGLVSGLAAAHQQTIVLFAPALALLLIAGAREDKREARSQRKRRHQSRAVKPAHFIVGSAMIVVGLLTYLYLPIAAASDPVVNFDDPETSERFINVVTRGPYGSFSLIPGAERGSLATNLGLYFGYLLEAFTPLGIALAALGSVVLWRSRRIEAWALLLAFFFTGPSFVVLAAAPLQTPVEEGIVERFFILSSIPLAVTIGAGVFAVVAWSRNRVAIPERLRAVVAGIVVLGLVGTVATLRWDSVDQSSNRVAERYAEDVLARLEPGAVLLSRGDFNYTSVIYAQAAEGLRPDVALLDLELLTLSSYVAEKREQFPDVEIPFTVYAREADQLVSLVEANAAERAVYAVGPFVEDVSESLDQVRAGLTRRLLPAEGGDQYGLLLDDPSYVSGLQFPESTYPDTTWESVIITQYGTAAHSLGFALHEPEPTPSDALVEEMYRLAIELGDVTVAYKNLGLFLWERGRNAAENIELWEIYLERNPDDAQANDLLRAIEQLRARL